MPLIRKAIRKAKAKGFWRSIQNRRNCFQKFAEEKGFDPLVRANWKSITSKQFVEAKGSGPLRHYRYNIKAALAASFPEWGQAPTYKGLRKKRQLFYLLTHLSLQSRKQTSWILEGFEKLPSSVG